MEIPEWVVIEVGRLHLDALALRRELAAREQQEADERPRPGAGLSSRWVEPDPTPGHPGAPMGGE